MRTSYSIDLSLQRTQPLTFDMFHNADLVLVMERQHLKCLTKQYPRQSRKIRNIYELSGKVYAIIDPVSLPNISLNCLTEKLITFISLNLVTLLNWLKVN